MIVYGVFLRQKNNIVVTFKALEQQFKWIHNKWHHLASFSHETSVNVVAIIKEPGHAWRHSSLLCLDVGGAAGVGPRLVVGSAAVAVRGRATAVVALGCGPDGTVKAIVPVAVFVRESATVGCSGSWKHTTEQRCPSSWKHTTKQRCPGSWKHTTEQNLKLVVEIRLECFNSISRTRNVPVIY